MFMMYHLPDAGGTSSYVLLVFRYELPHQLYNGKAFSKIEVRRLVKVMQVILQKIKRKIAKT